MGGSNPIDNPIPPYTVVSNGKSTSCDYIGGRSTVYEYPTAAATAAGTYHCDNAVYEETTVIMNIILELDVTVDEVLSSYSTVTKSLDIAPTHTPAQPPAPVMPSLIPAALGNLTASPN